MAGLRRMGCRVGVLLLFWLMAGTAAEAAAPVGKIVFFQGEVSVRRSGTQEWLPVQASLELFPGDALKTGVASPASILCADESQIKLNENTILVLKSVAPSARLGLKQAVPAALEEPDPSIYQVIQGEIWLRDKREKFRFELETPAVVANIRGTEVNIRVKPDGTTQVTLLEGKLCLTNP